MNLPTAVVLKFYCKTTDDRTIVTDGKPKVDSDTGLVSYKDAHTGRTEQINREKITNMSELDN